MSIQFLEEELEISWIDGYHWRLRTEFDWNSDDGKQHCLVPVGFITDFASIPRFLWAILPPTGPYGKAAVLHDYMYRTGMWTPAGPSCSRADADSVLRIAMRDLGVRVTQRWAVYSGVRSGGWNAWRRYRNADREL